jgi:hypothetical protein
MGACNFMTSVYAETAQDGYNILCDEAAHEYGHNSYNGTISTTFGFLMDPRKDTESTDDWSHRITMDPRYEKRDMCACTEATHVEKNDRGFPLWHFAGWAAE